jgi:hypothetical protein
MIGKIVLPSILLVSQKYDFVKLFNGLYVYHHWQKRTETRKMENVLQRSAFFIKTSWIDAFYKKSKSADIEKGAFKNSGCDKAKDQAKF